MINTKPQNQNPFPICSWGTPEYVTISNKFRFGRSKFKGTNYSSRLINIHKPVGNHGVNDPADVMVIQALLLISFYDDSSVTGVVDGYFTGQTENALNLFLKLGGSSPIGSIDPIQPGYYFCNKPFLLQLNNFASDVASLYLLDKFGKNSPNPKDLSKVYFDHIDFMLERFPHIRSLIPEIGIINFIWQLYKAFD